LEGPEAAPTQEARARLEENAARSGRAPLPEPDFSVPEPVKRPGDSLDDATHRRELEKNVQEAESEEWSVRANPASSFDERLNALGALATAYRVNQQAMEASRAGEDLVDMVRAKYGDLHAQTLLAERWLADLYWRVKQISKSAELRMKNLERSKTVFGPDDIGTLYIQGRVAQYLMSIDPPQALLLAKDASERLMRVAGPGHGATFTAMRELSLAHLREGRVAEALATIRQVAPEVTDDTFASKAYLCFLLWEGETKAYEEVRRRRIVATQAYYSNERFHAHRLYRTAWQCLLAPLDDCAQGEILAALIARADAIPEPKRSISKANQNLTKALLALRMGQAKRAVALLRPPGGSPPPGNPPASWSLRCQSACVLSMALVQLGQDEEARAAFKDARSALKPQPAEGSPYGHLAGYGGEPLDTWLLFKEAERLQ